MKKIIAYPITWGLYYIGDFTSKIISKFDYPEWICEIGWNIYNSAMINSLLVQDWAKLSKPWETPKDDDLDMK